MTTTQPTNQPTLDIMKRWVVIREKVWCSPPFSIHLNIVCSTTTNPTDLEWREWVGQNGSKMGEIAEYQLPPRSSCPWIIYLERAKLRFSYCLCVWDATTMHAPIDTVLYYCVPNCFQKDLKIESCSRRMSCIVMDIGNTTYLCLWIVVNFVFLVCIRNIVHRNYFSAIFWWLGNKSKRKNIQCNFPISSVSLTFAICLGIE